MDRSEVDGLCQRLNGLRDEQDRLPVLLQLLGESEHERHEDIVFELGLMGAPEAVPVISKAVRLQLPYLIRWGNLHEFQRKCAYALARIGTSTSRTVLEALALDDDPHLREFGVEGLEHWPLK